MTRNIQPDCEFCLTITYNGHCPNCGESSNEFRLLSVLGRGWPPMSCIRYNNQCFCKILDTVERA